MFDFNFQSIFDEYHSGDNIIKTRCIAKLHQFIYNYPKSRFKANEDTCSAFYEWFFPKLENLFYEYNPDFGLNFTTFIKTRVIYGFRNFVNRRKNDRVNTGHNDFYTIIDEVEHTTYEFCNNSNKGPIYSLIDQHLLQLHPQDELILRLYTGIPLCLRNFRYMIKKFTKKDFKIQYKKFLKLKNKRSQKIKSYREKALNNLQSLSLRGDSLKVRPLLQRRKKNLIDQLESCPPCVRLTEIAELLSISVSTVHRRLDKARNKLSTQLKSSGHNFNSLYAQMAS